ncbi:hypothetical protein [Synechocystis sp. PCC 7509]|uniref:hypothetical protein n=1 Tax=Synechocystis sp. PCC 7509 TaxID=927677 RepID=UPI00130DCF97|nr:hypothetical protein [Synechocystis sp. PCC 7509]
MNIALPQAALTTTLLAIAISNPRSSNVPPSSTIQSATSQDSTLLIATACC